MNKSERKPFLDATDSVLLPLGYERNKGQFEWRKSVESGDIWWVHINFGLGVLNPSFGIEYQALQEALTAESGAITGVSEVLSKASASFYDSDSSPELVAKDILEFGLVGLERLSNKSSVVERLRQENPKVWPTLSASHRSRLLPLLLWTQGAKEEALQWLDRFSQDERPDQLLPGYDEFSRCFRAKFDS